jgi:hypothetical protein
LAQLGVARLVAGDAERALRYFDRMDVPNGENLGRLLALHDVGREEEFNAEFETYRAISSPESIARVPFNPVLPADILSADSGR